MVSEKVIVVLLVVAILLSAISVTLTIFINSDSIRNMPIPNIEPKTTDQQSGDVSIIVNPPASAP